MESFFSLIQAAGSVSGDVSGIAVILLCIMYAVGQGWFRFSAGEQEEEAVPFWAQQLMQHFNHETTENQNRLEEKLDAHIKSAERAIYILEDIRTQGIRCRKE